jgi:hypothetical protein
VGTQPIADRLVIVTDDCEDASFNAEPAAAVYPIVCYSHSEKPFTSPSLSL